ncbi:MAG: hypothetical protein A3E01_03935 [Gammaproteobacteria bacterium RIFCSPHIGHO2_12_FULL_63_22]|nr:MAG: hypothetical protein A3E01_03935 [Gammaproteobacteria bacterium RIFCSPHIGHO2_12_FULL_63_22]
MKHLGPVALLICLVAAPLAAWAGSPKSLEENLQAAGRFNTFLELQKLAGPGKSGQAKGPRTYLVPNDAAFAALPPGELDKLKKDPAQIRKFLSAHTLPGRVTVDDMVGPGRSKSNRIKSEQGFTLEFKPATSEAVAAPVPAPAEATQTAPAPSEETPIIIPQQNLYIAAPPQVVEAPAVPNIPAPTQVIDLGMIAIEPINIQIPPPPTGVQQPPLVVTGLNNAPFQSVQIVGSQPTLSGGGSAYELSSPLMTMFYLGPP